MDFWLGHTSPKRRKHPKHVTTLSSIRVVTGKETPAIDVYDVIAVTNYASRRLGILRVINTGSFCCSRATVYDVLAIILKPVFAGVYNKVTVSSSSDEFMTLSHDIVVLVQSLSAC